MGIVKCRSAILEIIALLVGPWVFPPVAEAIELDFFQISDFATSTQIPIK
jgi:hypothetical protein